MGILADTGQMDTGGTTGNANDLLASAIGDDSDNASTATTASSAGASDGLIGGAINAITGGAMSHVMGMIFGGAEDDRQYNQAQRLQALQIGGAQQLADISQQEQMKTWYETNYPAQVQELEDAGLNPALLYAKGGPGGTLGSGSVPMPTGNAAPTATDYQQADNATLGMGLQLKEQQVMQSQIDLNEAQAAKAKTDATKTAGIDTTLATTQNESLTQGISNQQAQEALTKAQTELTTIQANIQNMSGLAQINTIEQQYLKTKAEAESAMAQAKVDQQTIDIKVDIMNQQFANMVADNVATRAKTANLNAETAVENFRADAAKAGISPDSPWYIKTISAIATKMGLNPLTQ